MTGTGLKFGARSLANLSSCTPEIQAILNKAIKHAPIDFAVIEGHRSEDRQNQLVIDGKSQLRWPKSTHNSLPSRGVDVVPYPVDWEDAERFQFLAGYLMATARAMGYELEWGGFWKSFRDMPHYQFV